MIDVLDWVKKRVGGPAAPEAAPAAAGTELPDLRGSDPVIALNELSGWLDPTAREAAGADPKARGEILAQVQDAGAAHVAALLGQYLTSAKENQAAREATWKSLIQYEARLTHALGRCAKRLLAASYEDAELLDNAEVCATRALHSCRVLAKICLVHYAGVPNSLWHMAYALHAAAEEIGSATSPVKADADPKKITSVEQEFLRLLMLQVSAPDMMAPEQIEAADRALEQVGEGLTLRPPGVADNPFCFEPQGDAAPRRASGATQAAGETARYFGPGMAFDALERIHRQLATARLQDIKVFGNDLSPTAQLGAVQHLLAFWQNQAPDLPTARAPASGKLQLVHRYAAIWKQLNDAQQNAGGLSLADPDDVAPQPPETWRLNETADGELGATFAQALGGWAKCGAVVGVTPDDDRARWVGVIRRMHRTPGDEAHADIAILSRTPRALSLREVREKGEDSAVSEAASRQFAFGSVRAVILADGADGADGRNLLLPADGWKAGRVYETTEEPSRYLRAVQVLRYGEDYVRATFEWLPGPG
ncbi:MAG TPA: hypothetical protein VLA41_07680 [Burkholderiales bacterium]|nr:hypothetical protein [Burkholderiales bacterium]